MQEVSFIKQLGGVSIIAGTAIGAGMLGIPFAVAATGFYFAVFLLFIVWIVMYATAMLLVEISSSQPIGVDMDSMAYNLLGKWGKAFNLIFYLLLLYSLLTAYIFMGGELFSDYILKPISDGLNDWSKVVFCVMFGYCIFMGTKATFYVNKFFLFLKILAFVMFVLFIIPDVKSSFLKESHFGFSYGWFAIPILVTSFGFHIVIPAIRNYYKNDKVFKKVVSIGAITPFIVYLIWVFVTLGTIPLAGSNGFVELVENGSSLAQGYMAQDKISVILFIKFFENFAIVTSFLGVALALFSFNKDLYNIEAKTIAKRLLILCITLAPPLFFAIYFVDSFISALGYASIFVAFLLIIQPAMMAWSLRTANKTNNLVSKLYLLVILLSGVGIITLQLLVSFGKLAHI